MRLDFSKSVVCVIGDLMLDRYCFGSVSRISPEAPVPVVNVTRTFDTLGGAGNVAHNCSRLGAGVSLVSPVAGDENGAALRRMCGREGIRLTPLPAGRTTITKTRVIGERQQIVRIDVEGDLPARGRLECPSGLKHAVRAALRRANVAVISDYGKGFCTPELCAFVIKEAQKTSIPVIVDPKGHRWNKYRGADVITPNVRELADVAGHPVKNDNAEIAGCAKKIRARFRCGAVLVTRSEKGMTIVSGKDVEHFPTVAREVYDVSGAGDTVVAALAACLGSGYPLREAAAIANTAAGIVVGKVGTMPVELSELRAELDKHRNPKLLDTAALVRRCTDLRRQGKKIVFTNGCFDILHRGHVHLLQEAKKLGDLLIVALNSDTSAKAVKGQGFPINTESDRAHLMAAIDAVDCITVFRENSPVRLIQRIRPDVIVKGGNYRSNEVVGSRFAGKTVIIPQLAGYSTRDITRKIAGNVN